MLRWIPLFPKFHQHFICLNIYPSISYSVPLSMRHFSKLERDLSSIDDPNSIIFWILKYSDRLSSTKYKIQQNIKDYRLSRIFSTAPLNPVKYSHIGVRLFQYTSWKRMSGGINPFILNLDLYEDAYWALRHNQFTCGERGPVTPRTES